MNLGPLDTQIKKTSRRQLLTKASLGALSLGVSAAYASDRYSAGASPVRYPDPDIIALDKKRFKYGIGNAVIKREYTGMRWAEGPAWNGVGQFLVWSDIASNQQLRLTTDNQVISKNFIITDKNKYGFSIMYIHKRLMEMIDNDE